MNAKFRGNETTFKLLHSIIKNTISKIYDELTNFFWKVDRILSGFFFLI